jgi:hypothetical protein
VPIAAAFARRHRLHLWTVNRSAAQPFVADADIPARPHTGAGIEAAVATLDAPDHGFSF